jgi:N-acetylmuramoyl-L-alanine amidase
MIAAMTRQTSRGSTRKKRPMAVRPQPRPTANRSQIGFIVLAAAIITLGLAVLTSAQAGGLVTSTPTRTPLTAIDPVAEPPTAIAIALEPTAAPTPTDTPADAPTPTDEHPGMPLVGIVAGHWGNDSGAECPDGVTEQQVNLEIARRVTEKLRAAGVWTDLLQEFDSRLNNYRADVLLSIHADSCDPIDADPPATGFKVARSAASAIPTTEDRLVTCLKNEYQKVTKMAFHANSITHDMTSYHSFSEVNPDTPAAIIETGFLYLDYDIIVKQPDLPAQGIANGILCFLDNQP